MHYSGLESFLKRSGPVLVKGPVGMIFAEDDVEIDSTVRHHLKLKFKQIVVFMPDAFTLDDELAERVHRVTFDITAGDRAIDVINKVIERTPHNVWLYYCYNAEYLFFPFCETRSVGEMLDFHSEERRRGMLAYVIDVYAGDLNKYPNAVSLKEAFLDKSGYYALGRPDLLNNGQTKERQLNFYGGLRWRFEEHVVQKNQKIDRIALFRVQDKLVLRNDHTFNDEEYNTYACPWHNNLTAAIVSFRVAKALKTNPGSFPYVNNFIWHNSVPLEWTSMQLLELGLMETGQWF